MQVSKDKFLAPDHNKVVVSKIFFVSPLFGEDSQFDQYFSDGGWNHQLDKCLELLQAGEEKSWKGEKKETYFLAIQKPSERLLKGENITPVMWGLYL